MSSLPETLWFEILVKVPVKTIFVCKCVCKFMRDFISHTNFARLHTAHAVQKNNLKFLFSTVEPNSSTHTGFSVSKTILSVTYDLVLASKNIMEYTILSDIPYKNSEFEVTVLGSSQGLVFLLFKNIPSVDEEENIPSQYFFYLWNPATTEYMKLPDLHSDYKYNDSNFRDRTFGYDHKTDNFKLVFSQLRFDEDDGSIFCIFNLRQMSWSTQIIPYVIIHSPRSEVFLNGSFHWESRMYNKASEFVLSWDINEEVFKEMQLPNISWGQGHKLKGIGVMDLHLCVIVLSIHVPMSLIDVWVMQKYGSGDSWCKFHTITHETIVGNPLYRGWNHCFYPLSVALIFKSGEILFWIPGEGLLYDPKHQKVIEKGTGNCHFLTIGQSNYLETMVSLGSGTYVVSRCELH